MEPEELVWAPHPNLVYAIGRIKKRSDSNQIIVQIEQDGTEVPTTKNAIQIINPVDLRDFSDMVNINDLSEASLLHNLKLRYQNNKIYTWIGNVLVSINPFKPINLYGQDRLAAYSDASKVREMDPHIFSVSSMAYAGLRSDRRSQSIIISGESGSGKTEASKSLLEFLAHRSGGGTIATDILSTNPILEAFGNATTTRNNNSSRFGKFIKVEFDSNGAMRGALIETYLLEKSRISHRPDLGNMNYHIFYYLVNGASAEERKRWVLESVEHFRYLTASSEVLAKFRRSSPDGLDAGAKSYQRVKEALLGFGCGADECCSIFQTVSAILHLGNIEFIRDESNYAAIAPHSQSALETTARLLGYPPSLFKTALISRNLKAIGRGSVYARPMEVVQAEEARDSMAKSLYAKIFQFVVDKINKKFLENQNARARTNTNASDKLFIGVLDIFGFENMTSNSLEQLLINFTNEKLQSQFIQEVFEREQRDYVAEGISWSSANFTDNKQCLEMIEKKGQGILALLDDECVMPKGAEATLLEKLNRSFLNQNGCYQRSLAKGTFGVRHFAGDVVYQMDGWLEKNRDTLFGDLEELLSSSSNLFVRSLFQKQVVIGSGGNKKGSAASVAGKFLDQLNALLSVLSTTSLSYVRCIKPNSTLSADSFHSMQVITQLRSVGLLSTVQVRKQGYSYRRDFKQFISRYSIILQQKQQGKKQNNKINIDNIQLTKSILEFIEIEFTNHLKQQKRNSIGSSKKLPSQVGKTKVFISDELYIFLEKFREKSIDQAVRVIQRCFKMFVQRKQFKQRRQSALLLQCCVRSHLKRKEFAVKLLAERKRIEEERLREEERKRKEEEKRQKEEEKRQREEEKQRAEEEAKRKKEEEKKRKEEEKLRKEEEKKRKEEEKKKKKERPIAIAKDSDHLSGASSSESEDDTVHKPTKFDDAGTSQTNGSASMSPADAWRKRDMQNSKIMNSPPLRQISRSNSPVSLPTPISSSPSISFPGPSVPSTTTTTNQTSPTAVSKPIPIVNSVRNRDGWVSRPSPTGRPSPSTNKQSTRIGRSTLRSSNLDLLRLSNSPSSSPSSATPKSGSPASTPPMSAPTTPSSMISPISSPVLSPRSLPTPLSLSPKSEPVIYPEETEKNLQMRTKIISEIIETERDYVRDLQIVVEVFLTPIRERAMLQPKDINILFSNLEILLSINKTMLEELEKEDEPSHYRTQVGHAFEKMSHYLKMYNAYCSNQQAALKILEDEQEKNEVFKNFLETCMADSRCRGLALLSFIIKPVQRICKYPLLLRETLRYTAEFHPERIPLEEAEKKINIVVTTVNEGKRTVEMFQKIFEIQSTIENIDEDLVKPGRVLLQEATVTSVRELAATNDTTLQRSIFLFNDLILICGPASVITSAINNFKSKKHIYRLKGRIPISEARIMFVSDTDSVKFALEICHLKDESSKYILCFNTEQQRSQWLKQIKSMIQEHKFNLSKMSSPLRSSPISSSTTNLHSMSPIIVNNK